jgi:hypothetical protein
MVMFWPVHVCSIVGVVISALIATYVFDIVERKCHCITTNAKCALPKKGVCAQQKKLNVHLSAVDRQ